jgi:transcriptional regulator with XRE-family HTH domain
LASLNVRGLGDYIRDQRKNAQISLRQLSRLAGVSNPYLSQIERGLRKPSAEILQQIAKALRISAEALYVQAGILEQRRQDSEVPAAIASDLTINDRQKQVLLDVYESFRRENEDAGAQTPVTPPDTRSAAGDGHVPPVTLADSSPRAPRSPRRARPTGAEGQQGPSRPPRQASGG